MFGPNEHHERWERYTSRFIDSYIEQAKLYLHKGASAMAKERLLKAQSIEHDHVAVVEMLEKIPPELNLRNKMDMSKPNFPYQFFRRMLFPSSEINLPYRHGK